MLAQVRRCVTRFLFLAKGFILQAGAGGTELANKMGQRKTNGSVHNFDEENSTLILICVVVSFLRFYVWGISDERHERSG